MPNATDEGAREPAGAPAAAEAHNLALVLRQIASAENLSRAQLAVRTGLTKATVSTLVDSLIEADLVIRARPRARSGRAPGSPLGLNPDGPAGLGVEINVDYVSACVVDLTGAVRCRRTS